MYVCTYVCTYVCMYVCMYVFFRCFNVLLYQTTKLLFCRYGCFMCYSNLLNFFCINFLINGFEYIHVYSSRCQHLVLLSHASKSKIKEKL
jgi:hypothetical protein